MVQSESLRSSAAYPKLVPDWIRIYCIHLFPAVFETVSTLANPLDSKSCYSSLSFVRSAQRMRLPIIAH